MSFKINGPCPPDPCHDRFLQLTPRAQKTVLTSWAKGFADHIYPNVQEQRFAVLYSPNPATRPNTPVNIIVSLMILQELFHLTDEELLDALECDIRFQYAVHTTAWAEQPVSDRSLSRFRKRNKHYYEQTGIDLIHEEMEALAKGICRVLGVDARFFRMDSVMVEANCKKMSRLETIHASIQDAANALVREDEALLPDHLRHYCQGQDHNRLFYHQRDVPVEQRMQQLLLDGDELLCLPPVPSAERALGILRQVFAEQTDMRDQKRCLKDGRTIPPDTIQNPCDPDATYRSKRGDHIGYVANLVETVSPNGSIIMDMDYQPNLYSDSQFCQDILQKWGTQKDPVTLLADGAYSGHKNQQLAKKLGITLITTNLVGKKNDPCKADFMLDEESHTISACPGGQAPKKSVWWAYEDGSYRLVFDPAICKACTLQERCGVKIRQRSASIQVLERSIHQTRLMLLLSTPQYQQYARIRNGVEAIPSLLRRRYAVDRIPVHGLVRSKMRFLFKIAAINVSRMIQRLHKKEKEAKKKLSFGFFIFFQSERSYGWNIGLLI